MKRTADESPLDTRVIFLSYEKGSEANEYIVFVTDCQILKEVHGFLITLSQVTLHFCVNTNACSYGLHRPTDVH